jgi:hypothetical protein
MLLRNIGVFLSSYTVLVHFRRHYWAVTSLIWLVVGFPSWLPEFDARSVRAGFVVNNVTMERVIL